MLPLVQEQGRHQENFLLDLGVHSGIRRPTGGRAHEPLTCPQRIRAHTGDLERDAPDESKT